MVAAIALAIGAVGLYGFLRMETAFERTVSLDDIAKNFLQRETDHLNWVRKAGEFQRDDSITQVNVEREPHKCGFGQWYYGEQRKQSEARVPGISEILLRIEEPHKKLHESVVELEKLLQQGKDGRVKAIAHFKTETGGQLKRVQECFAELRPKIEAHAAEDRAATERLARSVMLLSISGVVLGVALALALGVYLSISLTRILNRVSQTIATGAESTAEASGNVSAASQSLAEGAVSKPRRWRKPVLHWKRMSSMTQRNAANAQQANELAKAAPCRRGPWRLRHASHDRRYGRHQGLQPTTSRRFSRRLMRSRSKPIYWP